MPCLPIFPSLQVAKIGVYGHDGVQELSVSQSGARLQLQLGVLHYFYRSSILMALLTVGIQAILQEAME